MINIAEISKSKKANQVKPDIDEIFDDTFPAAAKSQVKMMIFNNNG